MLLLGLVRARAVSINVAAARARASASASVRGCLSAAPPRPAPLLGALGARAAAFSTESSAVVAAVPFYIKHPLMVAIAVATVKTAAADLLIQKQVEHRKEVGPATAVLLSSSSSPAAHHAVFATSQHCDNPWSMQQIQTVLKHDGPITFTSS